MRNEDGSIIIKAIIDSKDFYKQIKEIENTDIEDIEIKIDPNADVEKLQKEIIEAYSELSKFKDLDVISHEELTKMQTLIKYIESANNRIEELGGDKVILSGLNDATEDVKEDIKDIRLHLDNVGKSLTSVTKKITKWGLALFGIRSAYSFIRNMISQVVNQNEELGEKMEYIKFALSTVFEPIAKFIVDVIYNILAGLGAIIKAITGVNIFAKATAKNFNKANKSAGKLKKTLAGFDEVNVLNGENGSGGGLANGLVGDFQNKIGDFAEKVKSTFEKIIHFIRFDFLDKLRYLFGPIGDIIYLPFLSAFTFIETLGKNLINGIKNIIGGIKKIFQGDLVGGLKDIFSGLLDILLAPFKALGEAVKAVGNQIIDSFNYWKDTIGNLITGIWDKIKQPIKNLVNKIKSALGFKVDIEVNTKGGGGSGSYGGGGSSGGRAKGGIYYPKLAMGGIINQPGRGVPYHGATIGERGAEAVVPLTDSQQMALLGEAIGRYITVNLTNVTELDGRTIARKVQEVSNNTNFLLNR